MMYGGYSQGFGGQQQQQQDPYAGRMLAPYQNRVQPVPAPNAAPPPPITVPQFPTAGGGGGGGGMGNILSAVGPAISAGTSLFGMFGGGGSGGGGGGGGSPIGGGGGGGGGSGMDWGTIASLAGLAAMFFI